MFEVTDVESKIHELYPDIKKFGIFLTVKKDRLINARNYELTWEKDTRKARLAVGIDDIKQCMDGIRCSLITMEFAKFIKQFIDENYSVSGAG